MPSENEVAVGKFWGPFWSKGDHSVAEEIFAPDFVDIDPQWPSGAEGKIEAMKEKNSFFRGAFPDFDFTVHKQLVVDDDVVCHWKGKGTHQGDFGGVAPTGKSVTVEGIGIFTCRNGKIVHLIITYDVLGILQQVGAVTFPVR
jgi:predicted ester cyclase